MSKNEKERRNAIRVYESGGPITNNWIASRSCRTLFVPYQLPLLIHPSPFALARRVSNHFREEDANDPVGSLRTCSTGGDLSRVIYVRRVRETLTYRSLSL